MCLNDDFIWSDLNVVVCELELLFSDFYVVVSWVLDWNCKLSAFSDGTDQLKLLNILAFLYSDRELVEDVFA